MDIDYGEGKTRRVTVADGTPITKMAEVGMAALKPGTSVTAMATKGSDGKAVANMILVGAGDPQSRP
jgi:hypothetical protein